MVNSKLRATASQSPREDGTPLSYDSAQQRWAGPGPIRGKEDRKQEAVYFQGLISPHPCQCPIFPGCGSCHPHSCMKDAELRLSDMFCKVFVKFGFFFHPRPPPSFFFFFSFSFR